MRYCRDLLLVFGSVIAFCSSAAPALADGPVSLYVGTGAFFDSSNSDAELPIEVGGGYDFGPKTPVPVRFRADLDYSFDSNTVNADFSNLALGISARLTTPTYVGAGVSIDNVTLREDYVCPAFGCGNIPSPNTTGIGGTIFAGHKLVTANNFGLAVEASYKFIPSTDFTNLSQFGFGLRANL